MSFSTRCIFAVCLLTVSAQTQSQLRTKRGEPPVVGNPGESGTLTIQMPGSVPKHTDSYLCSAFNISELLPQGGVDPVYITEFEPYLAVSEKAHHMLLYTCEYPSREKIWDCAHHTTCSGGQSGILFAWAKNADGAKMPDNVAFELSRAGTKNLVLQVHYAVPLQEKDYTGLQLHYRTNKPLYLAGIHLMGSYGVLIPPETAVTHADVNCKASRKMHPFAFRTHAHQLGVVITGYKVHNNKFFEIARGNPQWPQAFYPTKKIETIEEGDDIVARCTFNSIGRNRTTHIGPTGGDEMCNLYLMYYVEDGKPKLGSSCWSEKDPALTAKLPSDSDQPLPPNPLLEETAKHSSKKGDLEQQHQQLAEHEEGNKIEKTRKKGDLDSPLKDEDLRPDDMSILEIKMPGAEPKSDDEYFCTAFKVDKLTKGKGSLYITAFNAEATADKAHHLILQKCSEPVKEEGKIWSCRHHATCREQTKIMYAWAKDAPPTSLPPEVGFKLDSSDGYLVLQVHYAHGLPEKDYTGLQIVTQTQRPKHLAGIFLMLRSYLLIPPNTDKVHGDVNCKVEKPMTLFAYRTHAHSLGSVITGYKIHDGEFEEVARGDPQKPQTFYPMKRFQTVNRGDHVAARCTFNNSNSDKSVRIGATAGDEMCNLYLMYFTDDDNDQMRMCFDESSTILSNDYPADSDLTFREMGLEKATISYENGHHNVDSNSLIPEKEKKKGDAREGKEKKDTHLYAVPNWPTQETAKLLGQVSGVSIDIFGNPVIFHRGGRTWDTNSFFRNNIYSGDKKKPIAVDTILTLNASGSIINSWGKDLFFMPHMITVDSKNNFWVADVALHQVFRFGPYGGKPAKPIFTLGEAFVPGTDENHFCKPTSIAVSSDDTHFFVADGYCNSRIIKYEMKKNARTGLYDVSKLLQWGDAKGTGFSITRSPYAFNVPHSLALAEDKNLICVADRENSRVQCFDMKGKFVRSIQPKTMGRVYAIAYSSSDGGSLYAVNGPEAFGAITGIRTEGLVININNGEVKSIFNGNGDGFQNPHDIAVSKDGNTLYETELNPFRVWKLTNGKGDTLKQLNPVLAVPGSSNFGLDQITDIVPSSTLGVSAAIGSLALTCLISICLACRRWRKRGKGVMAKSLSSNGKNKSKKSNRKKDGKLNLGDFLGRSKEGFQPVKTEDDDDDENQLIESSDSDDLEEFSVPALRA